MFDAIIMADLHFGAIDVDRFEYELGRCLFDRINHMKELDAIIIAGDLFDMKEYSTSAVFKAAISFIKTLLVKTEELGTNIVILKGTRNHDDYQLRTLELIYKDYERVTFIHTVCDSEINGVKFLWIPEEYVLDQDEYYKEWFSKKYDIIVGHGTIDDIWRSKKQKRSDITSAPVFNVEKLCSIANYCYFGHEHMHKEYGQKKMFKYVGPTTTWEYDKPNAGYYVIHYSPENGLCREEYIDNEYAQILIERRIQITDDTTIDDVMNMADSAIDTVYEGPKVKQVLEPEKDKSSYDGLKIKVDISGSCPIYIQAKNYLITKVGLYPNIKLDINTIEVEEETTEEIEERHKTEELHSTIFTNSLPDESVIAEYIKSKNRKDISLDRIKEVCGIGGETVDG